MDQFKARIKKKKKKREGDCEREEILWIRYGNTTNNTKTRIVDLIK